MTATPTWAGCAIPDDLLYELRYDVWVRLDGDIATVGMTDVAQTRCGRLVQLSWKSVGASVSKGRPLGVIESAKWVGPFVSPLTGSILENNASSFEADVAVANRDPYGSGWLYRIKAEQLQSELQDLAEHDVAFAHYRSVIDENNIRCFRCAD